MGLFAAHSDPPTELEQLAELFFQQLAAFGRLSTFRSLFGDRPSAARLAAAQLRCTWTADYLQMLEGAVGLAFGETGVAYCRAGDPWDATVAAGGWTNARPGPLPSHVATALCRCWNLAGAGARQTVHAGTDAVSSGLAPPSAALHLLRACLWVCQTAGLRSALAYLLDLHAAGFLVDGQQLVDLMDLLLLARCQVQSDVDLAARFFGGSLPADHATWSSAAMYFDWIHVNGIADSWHVARFTFDTLRLPIVPEVVEPLVMGMVDAGLQAIERVRACASWDEWLLAQVSLGVRLEVTLHAVARTIPRPSLGVRSILSQFREVRADVGALANGVWLDPNLPSFVYGAPASLFKQVVAQYRAALGEGWQERLLEDRALVPRSLQPLMVDRTTSEIPREWDAMTWRLAHPVAMTLRPQTHAVLRWDRSETEVSVEAIAVPSTPVELTRPAFDAASLGKLPAVQQAFQQFGIAKPNTQTVYLRRVFGSPAEPSEGADPLSEASFAVARTADGNASTWPQTFSGLDPEAVTRAARTVVRYDVCQVLAAIRTTLCELDVARVLGQSMNLLQQHQFSEAQALLDQALAIYPWHHAIHRQRAVVLNVLGQHAEAIESLRAAIALDKDVPEQWQLLAATLQRLDRQLEAAMATGVAELVQARGLRHRDV